MQRFSVCSLSFCALMKLQASGLRTTFSQNTSWRLLPSGCRHIIILFVIGIAWKDTDWIRCRMFEYWYHKYYVKSEKEIEWYPKILLRVLSQKLYNEL